MGSMDRIFPVSPDRRCSVLGVWCGTCCYGRGSVVYGRLFSSIASRLLQCFYIVRQMMDSERRRVLKRLPSVLIQDEIGPSRWGIASAWLPSNVH